MTFMEAHGEAIVVAIVGGVAAAVSAMFSAAVARRAVNKTADATMVKAEADVQDMINAGFRDFMAAHKQSQKDANEKIEVLTGEVRELTQHLISLESLLRANGIPVPERRFMPHRLSLVPAVSQEGE